MFPKIISLGNTTELANSCSADEFQFQPELVLHHPLLLEFWVCGKSCVMSSLMGCGHELLEICRNTAVRRKKIRKPRKGWQKIDVKKNQALPLQRKSWENSSFQAKDNILKRDTQSVMPGLFRPSTCFLYSLRRLTTTLTLQYVPSLFTDSTHWCHQRWS